MLIYETKKVYGRSKPVITILYQIVKPDTNNDSRLTINDQQTVALSQPDGSKYKEVIRDIDDVLGYELIDQQSIAVMYYRDDAGYIAYFDLASFGLIKEIELPKFK